MLANVRAFPVSGWADGKPTITSCVPLLKEDIEKECNNISVVLKVNKVSREYKADNRRKTDEVKYGYDGTVTFYGVDKAALAAITNNYTDANGSTVLKSSSDGSPSVVLFYQGRDERGTKYNMWLYDVEFDDPDINAEQPADQPKESSMTFFAATHIINKESVAGVMVWEGQDGYIAEGTEPTAAGLVMPKKAS